jgi:hypothetical protein
MAKEAGRRYPPPRPRRNSIRDSGPPNGTHRHPTHPRRCRCATRCTRRAHVHHGLSAQSQLARRASPRSSTPLPANETHTAPTAILRFQPALASRVARTDRAPRAQAPLPAGWRFQHCSERRPPANRRQTMPFERLLGTFGLGRHCPTAPARSARSHASRPQIHRQEAPPTGAPRAITPPRLSLMPATSSFENARPPEGRSKKQARLRG